MKIPEVLTKQAKELEQYYEEHYPPLAEMVGKCFLNTIETTVKELEDGSMFVITGDIPAMWLRDSAAQVRPYVRFANGDEELRRIIEGVIEKQAQFVCIDAYANAFNESNNGAGHKDDTLQNDHVWERKYEVDSLCAPLYLAHTYYKTIGSEKIFTDSFHEMIRCVARVFRTEQDHRQSEYSFQRYDAPVTDTLPRSGRGRPVNVTGMTWSGFRPSDDCCTFGYLIPANMMAEKALKYAAEFSRSGYRDEELAAECEKLSEEIEDGIRTYGTVLHPKYGRMYAYETDGFGNYNLMDDANSPGLLAMPYLEYCKKDDPLYRNTRCFVLSEDNPYYYSGTIAKGVGSPHTPEGYIWHIGIIMQALTSDDREEILDCLDLLSKTHAGTGYMHESFDPDDPEKYTRPWFAWANTLFAELLTNLKEEKFF